MSVSSRRTPPPHRARLWWSAAALLVGAGGAYFLLRDGMVDAAVARRDAAGVIRFGATSHDAHRLLAETALLSHRPVEARRHVVAALARAPLDRRALRTAALIEDAAGNTPRAATLMNRAAQLSWRDMSTQTWLLRQALATADPDAAVQRADAILRTGHYVPAMLALLRAVAMRVAWRGPIAAALADAPEWRRPFLASLRASGPAAAGANIALLDTIATTATPPTEAETAPFLSALLSAGYGRDAAALWGRITPPAGGSARSGLIDDPDFTRNAGVWQEGGPLSPFSWAATMQADATAVTGATPDGRPALVITESGAGADRIVERAMALTPGRYRLTYQADPDGNADPRRIVARVHCWTPDINLAATGPADSRSGLAFTVPAGCDVQRLAFSIRPADTAFGSTYFLHAVQVEPMMTAARGGS